MITPLAEAAVALSDASKCNETRGFVATRRDAVELGRSIDGSPAASDKPLAALG